MIKSIDEIVKENIKFRIPELQRSYVWNEVQWEQFWEDIRRVYYLEVPSLNQKTICSYDGWFRELYSVKALGANVDDGKTVFRVFAPRATNVILYLYNGKDDKTATRG